MSSPLKTSRFTIAIFGEVLADIFPDNTVLGGAPYNVARHLRAFEQHPILISRVGNDALKDTLFAELSTLGIDSSGIQLDSAMPTGRVSVHMKNGTHRFEIQPDQAYDYIDIAMAQKIALATKPDFAYFGTLVQRSHTSRLALDKFLSSVDCPKFLDINLRAPWYDKSTIQHSLLHAEIVKMNEEELNTVSHMFDSSPKDSRSQALFLIQKFNISQLFVTCGDAGAWALSNNGEETSAEGQQLQSALIDTVGAGDAFSAICILGLLHNWPTKEILIRANSFAAALCTLRGAAPKSDAFYLPYNKVEIKVAD